MVSADEPLAAGVVDALLAQGTRAVGPTRAGAEIEWNKVFARELLSQIAPEAVPLLRVAADAEEVEEAIDSFGSMPVAVKPSGLTGGKGVKVMGPHLASHAEARDYALSLLARGEGAEAVLIEERVIGRRVHDPGDQRRTPGAVPARHLRLPVPLRRRRGPGNRRHGLAVDGRAHAAVHDREPLRAGLLDHRAGDRAPRAPGAPLHGRHEQRLLRHRRGREGDRVQRSLRRSRVHEHHEPVQRAAGRRSWSACPAGSCARATCPLREEASLVLYLVSPDYALRAGSPYEFELDAGAMEAAGCHVFFASAVRDRRESLLARWGPRARSRWRRRRPISRTRASVSSAVRELGGGARVAPGRRRRRAI